MDDIQEQTSGGVVSVAEIQKLRATQLKQRRVLFIVFAVIAAPLMIMSILTGFLSDVPWSQPNQ